MGKGQRGRRFFGAERRWNPCGGPTSAGERVVGWLTKSRRVASRFAKLAVNFLAMVKLAMTQGCLRLRHSSIRT